MLAATAAGMLFALVTTVVVADMAAAGPVAPTAPDLVPTAVAALAAVDALPPTPNTAWGIDPATGQLAVTVSGAAPHAGVARLLALARRFGDVVRIDHTDRAFTEQLGPLVPPTGALLGGDQINNGKIVCSAAFNVVHDGQAYVLTAGHCTAGLPQWHGIGPSTQSQFPGTDYGLIRDDTAQAGGDVDLYNGTAQQITSVATPAVGDPVCASGQTTQVTCGQVQALDQSVDYGDGAVVHGLIKTTVHTESGDSGGSLFQGQTALGLVSGGDGTTDYFQPLAPVMAAQSLQLAAP